MHIEIIPNIIFYITRNKGRGSKLPLAATGKSEADRHSVSGAFALGRPARKVNLLVPCIIYL